MLVIPNVESTDPDWNSSLEKRARQVERMRKLVRLDADQHHHSGSGALDHLGQPIGTNTGIRFVKRMNLYLDIIAEDMPLCAIASQPIDGSERIGRNSRTEPLDDIALVIVVRRFNEDEAKSLSNG